MLSRRSMLVSAAGLVAMPYVARAGHLRGAAPAVTSADFALGLGWAQRWRRFPHATLPSSAQKTATGLQMTGSQLIVSRKTITKAAGQRLVIRFTAVDLSGHYGTEQQSMLLYVMLRGPGSASRPANIADWSAVEMGETPNVERHRDVRAYVTTWAPRGSPADWGWRVRLRMWMGDGRAPRLVDNSHNPAAPPPGPFHFMPGVAYECTQVIRGQTYRWRQRCLDTGETLEMVVTDARFNDFLSGNVAFRPMDPLSFEVRDLSVTVS